ncbi:MAG: hypothetical protein ABEI52_03645, partial [Halobacteriaceae archaeon]
MRDVALPGLSPHPFPSGLPACLYRVTKRYGAEHNKGDRVLPRTTSARFGVGCRLSETLVGLLLSYTNYH